MGTTRTVSPPLGNGVWKRGLSGFVVAACLGAAHAVAAAGDTHTITWRLFNVLEISDYEAGTPERHHGFVSGTFDVVVGTGLLEVRNVHMSGMWGPYAPPTSSFDAAVPYVLLQHWKKDDLEAFNAGDLRLLFAGDITNTSHVIPVGGDEYMYFRQEGWHAYIAPGGYIAPVPEPSTIALTCMGLLAIGTALRVSRIELAQRL